MTSFVPLETTGEKLLEDLEARRLELRREAREDCVCVSIREQKLWHFRAGKLLSLHTVSTSRAAPSCVADSLGTPTGLHQIAEKIGAGEPPGMVFKGRKPQGYLWREAPPHLRGDNLITTRILWLDGLEPGHNQGPGRDTHSRHIYIHGTNQHEKLGTPNSHGCVLLSDEAILRLFDTVPAGAFVWIG